MAPIDEPAARGTARQAPTGGKASTRPGGAAKTTLLRGPSGRGAATEHVNVTIPADLVARARSLASDTGQPLSRVLSDALDQYLHLHGLAELLGELNAEYGTLPPDPAAEARWDAVLDQDQARWSRSQ